MDPTDTDAYDEGREAFEQGVAREDCPYPAETRDHEGWIEGWDEAQEARIVEGDDGEPI
ncbi:MAG TPA: Rmf/CrpP family protein [Rubellimicrobium sp.]|jgi:ribosome modulation factor|nr:Rmf/CrpP family protein [Rubellimicrobium sp.]